MNVDSSRPTKKRRLNADDDEGIGRCNYVNTAYDDGGNLKSMRKEEELAFMSKLESRCAELEAKCKSLENRLQMSIHSVKGQIDSKLDSLHMNLEAKLGSIEHMLEGKVDVIQEQAQKFHEYNAMVMRNQRWEYSVDASSYDWMDDEATYILALKEMTIKMRRGEFPDGDSGIWLYTDEFYPDDPQYSIEYSDDDLLPHLKEFAAALEQFTPAMNLLPDNCESYFALGNVKVNHEAMLLIKDALIGKPFTTMRCSHQSDLDYDDGGMSMDAIIDVAESNKHLRRLFVLHNIVSIDHIKRLCSIVHNHPLLELELSDSCEPYVGDEMLKLLVRGGELKLEKLNMSFDHISSDVSKILADFIATNPRLKELILYSNALNNSDATLIANALRTNTTLRHLDLRENNITDVGLEAFRSVLCDESSLNSVADSNHCCCINARGMYENMDKAREVNKARKICRLLLSSTNKTILRHFAKIDAEVLPQMLEAIQTYARKIGSRKESLSIVYEVMRNWELA